MYKSIRFQWKSSDIVLSFCLFPHFLLSYTIWMESNRILHNIRWHGLLFILVCSVFSFNGFRRKLFPLTDREIYQLCVRMNLAKLSIIINSTSIINNVIKYSVFGNNGSNTSKWLKLTVFAYVCVCTFLLSSFEYSIYKTIILVAHK